MVMLRDLTLNAHEWVYNEVSILFLSFLFDLHADNFSELNAYNRIQGSHYRGKVDYREKLRLLFMVENLGFRVFLNLFIYYVFVCACYRCWLSSGMEMKTCTCWVVSLAWGVLLFTFQKLKEGTEVTQLVSPLKSEVWKCV